MTESPGLHRLELSSLWTPLLSYYHAKSWWSSVNHCGWITLCKLFKKYQCRMKSSDRIIHIVLINNNWTSSSIALTSWNFDPIHIGWSQVTTVTKCRKHMGWNRFSLLIVQRTMFACFVWAPSFVFFSSWLRSVGRMAACTNANLDIIRVTPGIHGDDGWPSAVVDQENINSLKRIKSMPKILFCV